MPIKHEQYQCMHCKTMYRDNKKAEECENFHVGAKSIVSQRHNNKSSNNPYPAAIEVKMADGATKIYKC